MAYLLNEQSMLENNAFEFENRLNSQVTRFLDKNPTFVTYYHVNVNESTVDEGFRDIEAILSHRSPLRFQKILNFPLYGIEAIVLNLSDNEQGLDTNFEGEAIILPNTIKPLQNDFFIINNIKGSFIFRVTEVQYDNIRPDNFYKINYRFEYLDDVKALQLEKQVHDEFTCILENIGTENVCLIENESLELINKINSLYNDMVQTYIHIFYNKRYNCFLGELNNGHKIFDPLQSRFINKHQLLLKKKNYSTIVLSEGFEDNRRDIKYEKSIYRFFERRDAKLAAPFYYNTFPGMYKKDSAFYRWHDNGIDIVDIPSTLDMNTAESMIPESLATSFKVNGPTDSLYVDFMQKFIRGEEISLKQVPLELNEELLRLDANTEVYFFTPILLYILKVVLNEGMKK